MAFTPDLWLYLPHLVPDDFLLLEAKDIRDLAGDVVHDSHGVVVG